MFMCFDGCMCFHMLMCFHVFVSSCVCRCSCVHACAGVHVFVRFQVFMSQAVDLLWSYTQSRDLAVASAAFTSLAKFTPSLFTPQHLPHEVS